jgi:hypothetical protein
MYTGLVVIDATKAPEKSCLTTQIPKCKHMKASHGVPENLTHAQSKLKYIKNMNLVYRLNKNW